MCPLFVFKDLKTLCSPFYSGSHLIDVYKIRKGLNLPQSSKCLLYKLWISNMLAEMRIWCRKIGTVHVIVNKFIKKLWQLCHEHEYIWDGINKVFFIIKLAIISQMHVDISQTCLTPPHFCACPVEISQTCLTPPHFCACPKSGASGLC